MTFSLGNLLGPSSSARDKSAPAADAALSPDPLRRPAERVALPRWRLQLGFVLGAIVWVLWLMALLTHDARDAAFSTSGDGAAIRNRIGLVGAWWSDLTMVLLGLSSGWCVLFLARLWLGGLLRSVAQDDAAPEDADRLVGGLHWLGLLITIAASCALEWTRLYRFEDHLAGAHAGGIVGATLGPLSLQTLGFLGSGVVWLALLLLGLSWAFGFTWLGVAEGIGAWFDGLRERRTERRERAADWVIGRQAQRQRARDVENERPVDALPDLPPLPPPVSRSAPPAPAPATRVEPRLAPIVIDLPPPPPAASQQPLFADPRADKLPQVDLLDAPVVQTETIAAETLEMTGRLIEKKLKDFGVEVRVTAAQPGPVITRYEIEPATGVKGSQVVNLAKDLARSLSLVSIRVVETIPGKTCMALELPNARRQTIRLSEVLDSPTYHQSASLLTMGLGKDIIGTAVVADLARMPHVLVAGTTGSGKSVGINAMILSLLYKAEARDVRLILIDPKMLEMSVYEGIPHLLAPVVTDMKQASNALTWCVAEMERRYKLLSKMGVRNLAGYNKKIDEATAREELIPNPFSLTPEQPEPLDRLPHIVVVIDELADLMMVVGKKIEELIARLAQKARAAGIHLILATQRPSVDVITGLIKANIPTRMSFQVSSKIDSRTILDQMGAEALLGQGDMLYLAPGTGLPIRVHGAFVSDDEVHRVVSYLKSQGEPNYIEGILEGGTLDGDEPEAPEGGAAGGTEADPMYDQAVAVVLQHRRASISLVQRHLRIGYNRAARLLEQMEQSGLVSGMATNGNRDILVPPRPAE